MRIKYKCDWGGENCVIWCERCKHRERPVCETRAQLDLELAKMREAHRFCGLTATQAKALHWIETRILQGAPPRLSELGETVAMSVSGAQKLCRALQRRGYLRVSGRGKKRSFEILRDIPEATRP